MKLIEIKSPFRKSTSISQLFLKLNLSYGVDQSPKPIQTINQWRMYNYLIYQAHLFDNWDIESIITKGSVW